MDRREAGFIHKNGWLVQFLFGHDEGVEYMDYYSTHRMAVDSHVRLHADGRSENLPALESIYFSCSDPEESRRMRREHDQRNRKAMEILVAKGFDKFTINMTLAAGLVGGNRQNEEEDEGKAPSDGLEK